MLDHAEALIQQKPRGGRHKEVDLRRSISASYYALFHAVLQTSADFLVDKSHRRSPSYLIVYRSLDHAKLKRVCDDVRRSTLPERYRKVLRTPNFQADIQQVAFAIVKLQEWRYSAEYNPVEAFSFVDALFTSSMAREAVRALKRASNEQLRLFTALLFFYVRA